MYILEPIFDYRLWGGSRLMGEYGEDAVGLAHLYSVYSKGGTSNKTYCGSSLAALFDEKKHVWGMGEFAEFPLTIALVDAEQDLSIQVHPTEDKNRKCESWYFLDAPYSGYIYNGCKTKSVTELQKAIEENNPMSLIDTVSIKTGDYINIEPGTIHAITAGSLLYEIEFGSDITYRLHDYNRTDDDGKPREMHINDGIAAADLGKRSSPVHYKTGSKIVEEVFFTELYDRIAEYTNQHPSAVCVTSLDDEPCCVEGTLIKKGMSILLEPSGTLCATIGKCIVAGVVRE